MTAAPGGPPVRPIAAGDDVQAVVQAAVDELVASGAEVGLQVAVFRHGELVVDAVGGTADPRTATPVGSGTLFFAASAAKGIGAALAHVLVEQGHVAYDLRLVDVWPEFGAHGKDQVALRHVLSHTAGVPGLPPGLTVDELCDWDAMCSIIAAAEPWWAPGTAFGYHAQTFGFLLGETLRRATGLPLATLLRRTLTDPLGIADEVHFGVPAPLLARVARQVDPDGPPPDPPEPGTPMARALPTAVRPDAELANRPDVLVADIPSFGTMSARGAARAYAGLLGHVDGVGLVSPARRTAMATLAFAGMDRVMGFETRWAFGFSPDRPGGRPARPGSIFGMVGMNGSAAWADIDAGLAVAVLRNRFSADLTAVQRVDESVARTWS